MGLGTHWETAWQGCPGPPPGHRNKPRFLQTLTTNHEPPALFPQLVLALALGPSTQGPLRVTFSR